MESDIMLKNDNGRKIPFKNYLYLGLIVIFSLMVIYYGYLWYYSYKTSLLQISALDGSLNVINFNELDDYIMENKDALVYVSVLGDEDINDFELKFVNTISEYSLRDVMLYMDVSDYDKSTIDSKFNSDGNYPYIVVYTNGKVTNTYSISDNGYSVKKIIKYFNRIGVLGDD
jgi:hypothetical protein